MRFPVLVLGWMLMIGCSSEESLPTYPTPWEAILTYHLETCPSTRELVHVYPAGRAEFPELKEICETMGVTVVEADGPDFEDDDVLFVDLYLESEEERSRVLAFQHFQPSPLCIGEVVARQGKGGWSAVPVTFLWVSDCDFSDL